MTIDDFTRFLGWCLVFNIVFILIFLFVASVFKEGVARLNARIFGVGEQTAKDTMFRLFYHYRLFVGFFNAIPWLVLYFVY